MAGKSVIDPGFPDAEWIARFGSAWKWVQGEANPEPTIRGFAPSEMPVCTKLEGDLLNSLLAGWRTIRAPTTSWGTRDPIYNGKSCVPYPRLDYDKGDPYDGTDRSYRDSDHLKNWVASHEVNYTLAGVPLFENQYPFRFFPVYTWTNIPAQWYKADLTRRLRGAGWVVMTAYGAPTPPDMPTEKIVGASGVQGVGVGNGFAGDNSLNQTWHHQPRNKTAFVGQDYRSSHLIPRFWLHPAPFTLQTWVVDARPADVVLDLSAYAAPGFLGKTCFTAWRMICARYNTKLLYKDSVLADGTLQNCPSSVTFFKPGALGVSQDIRWALQVGFEHVTQPETIIYFANGAGGSPDLGYEIPREEGNGTDGPNDVIFYSSSHEQQAAGGGPVPDRWRGWPPIPWDSRLGTPYGEPLPQTWIQGWPSVGGVGPVVYSGRANYDQESVTWLGAGANGLYPHPYYGVFASPMSLT